MSEGISERVSSKSRRIEALKIPVVGALVLLSLGLSYYFQVVLKVEVLYTHFFYIPIVLACMWWGRKGMSVPLLLGLGVLVFHRAGLPGRPLETNFGRALMFLLVGAVVSFLSEKKAQLEEELKGYSEHLEVKVEEHARGLRKSNRALRMLSESNRTLIRAKDEAGLLSDVCRIAIEVGGYRLAWFGLAEQDKKKTVRPVAQAGYEEGYLKALNLTWADTERGRGPTGTAIRTGNPSIARNIHADPNFKPWRAEAVKRGYASSIALPITSEGHILGALNIYAKEPNVFDKEEVELLTELANDLGYGISALRTREERKKAEGELQKAYDELELKVAERTEELSEANVRLKELDRLKSMFIASMSHELRTPLNSIIGFTGIILQGMVGKITEEQRKQLTMVKNSANHLLALINDVIDVSKIEAGKVELIIEEFDLAAVLREVEGSFAVAAKEKGLKVSLEMPNKLVIESDERRAKQVLVNLVGNAVKFTDGGEVKIEAAKRDGSVEVSVRDTGIGIRGEDMGKLFKAFSQIPIEGRSKEGTGLGLYLSKKISDLLGGEIAAESEFGKGSEFTFMLPLRYKGVKA